MTGTLMRLINNTGKVTEGEDSHPQPRNEDLQQINLTDTLILDFYSPKLWKNKFLLFKSPSLWYFISAGMFFLLNFY